MIDDLPQVPLSIVVSKDSYQGVQFFEPVRNWNLITEVTLLLYGEGPTCSDAGMVVTEDDKRSFDDRANYCQRQRWAYTRLIPIFRVIQATTVSATAKTSRVRNGCHIARRLCFVASPMTPCITRLGAIPVKPMVGSKHVHKLPTSLSTDTATFTRVKSKTR